MFPIKKVLYVTVMYVLYCFLDILWWFGCSSYMSTSNEEALDTRLQFNWFPIQFSFKLLIPYFVIYRLLVSSSPYATHPKPTCHLVQMFDDLVGVLRAWALSPEVLGEDSPFLQDGEAGCFYSVGDVFQLHVSQHHDSRQEECCGIGLILAGYGWGCAMNLELLVR